MRAQAAGWLLGVAAFCVSSVLCAQIRAPRSDVAPTLRFMLPFQNFSVVNGNERTEYIGLGLGGAVLIDGTWASEAGLGVKGGGDFTTSFVYARFGVTPTLVNSGDIEGGWTINAGPWVGFEAQWRGSSDDGFDPRERVQAFTQSVSVELVRWSTDGGGINIMIRTGLILPVSRSENETWSRRVSDSQDFHHAWDIGGSVGWSL